MTMGMKMKKLTPSEKAAKRVQNNCDIIKRLCKGNLTEDETAEIGESLATGKTLDEIRAGQEFANISESAANSGFSTRPN